MKKTFLLLLTMVLAAFTVKAQDDDGGLKISGSVDTYFKYDFSGYMNEDGGSNIPTSFATNQNSVSIGMIDIALEQTVGKASFVGELSFGPRGQYETLPNGPDDNSFHIQNLYVSYALSDKVSLTGGYMGTFVGYEVISPTANFNYSSSYLFWSGPFQNAGIKLDYAISDKFAVMVGLFDDWNVYQDFNGVSDFGAQVYVAPVDGWDVYLNFITGFNSDAIYTGQEGTATEFDLTTGFQISDAFYLGLNAATATYKIAGGDVEGGFSGVALYPQYAFSDAVSLGFRYEYFMTKDEKTDGNVTTDGENISAITVSLPISSGPLTFIPEIRFDSASDEFFVDSDMAPTKSASQISLAAIYAF